MIQSANVRPNVFSVDVEDYFHVSAFADRISPEDWGQYECRVEANTHRILDLCARHNVRGTFFVLGWVADRYPELVIDIRDAGHEIGCHSYWHQLIYELGPERFREDLVRGRDLLQEITGEAVTLYRAPSFSVTKKSIWALEIMVEEGFTVDSSVYPVRHDRYGIPDAQVIPHKIQTDSGSIVEFPGTICDVGGMNVPVGGGGYFRLFPWWLMQRFLSKVNRERQFNFYIHPWEVDPDQPRMQGSWKSRFRHYQNLNSTTRKLDQLMSSFDFTTMSEALQHTGLLDTEPAVAPTAASTGAQS